MNLQPDECIGYKVLLFLGGEDTEFNLEKREMVVYWNLCSQIIRQTNSATSSWECIKVLSLFQRCTVRTLTPTLSETSSMVSLYKSF
ncbi:T6SS immunity protein Tdi1 domain-containing protein [Bacillus spongiae]